MANSDVPGVLNTLRIVLDMAVKLKNEEKELAIVEKETSQVKDHLSLIYIRMKNPKSPPR